MPWVDIASMLLCAGVWAALLAVCGWLAGVPGRGRTMEAGRRNRRRAPSGMRHPGKRRGTRAHRRRAASFPSPRAGTGSGGGGATRRERLAALLAEAERARARLGCAAVHPEQIARLVERDPEGVMRAFRRWKLTDH